MDGPNSCKFNLWIMLSFGGLFDWFIDFQEKMESYYFPQKAEALLSAGGPCQGREDTSGSLFAYSAFEGMGKRESSRTHRTRVIQGWWGSGELLSNLKNLIVQGHLWRRSSHDIAAASGACWFLLHTNTTYFGSYDGALQAPHQRKSQIYTLETFSRGFCAAGSMSFWHRAGINWGRNVSQFRKCLNI